MQDRFKFRAVNMKTKEITYIDSFYWFEENGVSEIDHNNTGSGSFAEYWINQSTGLKDKNGKLIYEGDIVKDECSEAVATIEYLPYTFSLMAHIRGMDDYLPLEDICYALEVATPFEVIGNIYENPELLEDNK